MAAALRVSHLPDSVRAHYDSNDLDRRQMAKEVPRQYQRNVEDGQMLKFPSTKNILWDHESLGASQSLHISYFRKPRLCVGEKVLRFAQRHVESGGDNQLSCVLVGTLSIDDDNEGVLFNVERMDPVCDPNSSTSHAAGDMLIPFTIQCGSKERGSTSEDYMNALQLLRQRCCSKDPVELGNFLLTKGWCSFYTAGETSVHHLEFEVVTMGTEVKVMPIGPVPIVPTALSKNLSGPMSISHMQGTPKTGYLTMDHTRKLLLVLESDPKVTHLPLVGIWVSGVSYVYSPYIWACCLRYLHNSSIQDRVCSPPDPFLLVLYNPTHSKPEFYECCTTTGNNKMSFDFYTGYEAVQISKSAMGLTETVELDFNQVKDGSKYELFQSAVIAGAAQSDHNESRRSLSPEPVNNDDITPRLKPAPYKSRMPMVQSMVPEVSLFFGNEDTTFVPSVQHPSSRVQGLSRASNQPLQSSTPLHVSSGQSGHVLKTSVPNNSSAQNRLVPAAASNYVNNNNANATSNLSQTSAMRSSYSPFSNGPPSSHPSESLPSSQPGAPQQLASSSSSSHQPVPSSQLTHQGYPAPQPSNMGPQVPSSMRPPYCSCPSCPKPPPHFYNRAPGYDHMRGPPMHPSYPRHSYPNYGPPPPRLGGPPYNGYPGMHGVHQSQPSHPSQGMYTSGPGPISVSHSYPPTNDYPHSAPYSAPQPSQTPTSAAHYSQTMQQTDGSTSAASQGHPISQPTVNPGRSLPSVPTNAQNGSPPVSFPSSGTHQRATQQATTQLKPMPNTLAPQASGGVPVRAEECSPRTPGQSAEGMPVGGSGEIRRSNQSSDNSGRSSDDSGLSFTPEKHHSPSNPSPKSNQQPSGDIKTTNPTVNWENVPPEIYQLLMKQDQQLKQLQAQIEVLTAQSLNTTAESAFTLKQDTSPNVQKCTAATNTSGALNEKKEQVSACMQTSQQELQAEASQQNPNRDARPTAQLPHQPQVNNQVPTGNTNNNNKDMSSASSGSGYETRTPLEIRHRGRLPMNSTQREDGELDMSQGELVALINNMHDKTIDSVQSEMIVDLPSFQSSPSRSPRSQESCGNSAMFNLSPQSPISASMCEGEPRGSDTEYSDDEDGRGGEDDDAENTAGTDPEYYNRLMDNIKKLLSQNTTENTTGQEGYSGDVSSDPSTPVKLARDDINLGEHLQSFFKFDNPNTKTPADTTFIPKINYVSMFLDSDTDTSMEINAMAMKYLKDEQLTQLTKLQAKNRILQGNKKPSERTALLQKILKAEDESTPNVTAVGMSPNDLTFATKKYLEKHGLLDGTGVGNSTSDATQDDSYRLRTNYSTMTSGSEDGPAHVTHEVLGTPSSRQHLDTLDTVTPASVRRQDTLSSRQTTPGNGSVRTGYNDSRQTYNDSRQSDGFKGTPKPNHIHSRLEDHRRVEQNGNNSHNTSVPQVQNYSPYSQNPSPFLHGGRRAGGQDTGGRYVNPIMTPAPNAQNHSPPERDRQQLQPGYIVQQKNNAYRDTPMANNHNNNGKEMPAQQRRLAMDNGLGVPNYFSARHHREETNEDDRILDITRLKQLPKLL